MPTRSRKGKNNGDALVDDGDLSGAYKPIIIERGKKFAVYDKNGKLVILGYNRRIVEEYADAQNKIRFERQRKD